MALQVARKVAKVMFKLNEMLRHTWSAAKDTSPAHCILRKNPTNFSFILANSSFNGVSHLQNTTTHSLEKEYSRQVLPQQLVRSNLANDVLGKLENIINRGNIVSCQCLGKHFCEKNIGSHES